MSDGLTAPRALSYYDVRDYVAPLLAARGWSEANKRPVAFSPGPGADALEQKLSAQRIVFLDVGGGAGLHFENTYDRPFITVRIVGPQRDYRETEKLALALDEDLLAFEDGPGFGAGAPRGLYITRTGGRPQLLLRDPAERYHFTASYITETESGLT